ncbi:MAG TPA: hypothetical protein VF113_11705 [Stellaceae bacterium]
MRHYIVSPVIGGLVAIIVIGLFMRDGGSSLSHRNGMIYQSGYQPSSCNFAVSSDSLSPTLVGAVIRSGVHC